MCHHVGEGTSKMYLHYKLCTEQQLLSTVITYSRSPSHLNIHTPTIDENPSVSLHYEAFPLTNYQLFSFYQDENIK